MGARWCANGSGDVGLLLGNRAGALPASGRSLRLFSEVRALLTAGSTSTFHIYQQALFVLIKKFTRHYKHVSTGLRPKPNDISECKLIFFLIFFFLDLRLREIFWDTRFSKITHFSKSINNRGKYSCRNFLIIQE